MDSAMLHGYEKNTTYKRSQHRTAIVARIRNAKEESFVSDAHGMAVASGTLLGAGAYAGIAAVLMIVRYFAA